MSPKSTAMVLAPRRSQSERVTPLRKESKRKTRISWGIWVCSVIPKASSNPTHITVWLYMYIQFSSVQSLSYVRLFVTPWITARQASLSITNSWSWLKLMPIESVIPSSHLILCCPLLLLPPIPPNIRVFSNESTHCMRWSVLEFQLQHQSFQ